MDAVPVGIDGVLPGADWRALAETYRVQGEFICFPGLIAAPLLSALIADAERLRPAVHRTYLPRYKKGGSVSYHQIRSSAPTMISVYESVASLVSRLAGVEVQLCPDDDPHACALYFYTEPGDHIGFHYDTSLYAGARFTVLVGLVNRSRSKLECHLHTKDRARQAVEVGIQTDPGTVVIFNGDSVWHRVTPITAGEERISLSLEYVTSRNMSAPRRLLSNVKDAIAYFGVGGVFGRRNR